MNAAWHEYPELVRQITDLRREATHFYENVVKPQEGTAGYAQTLYGYMHRVFAFIDTLSAYWRGSGAGNQTSRMVDFMDRYLNPDRAANSVAVQIWRHKLIHTALPRNLLRSSGEPQTYLIHWHESRMGGEPVYSVGRLACISLIEMLERGTQAFVADVLASKTLQANAAKFAQELASSPLRTNV